MIWTVTYNSVFVTKTDAANKWIAINDVAAWYPHTDRAGFNAIPAFIKPRKTKDPNQLKIRIKWTTKA
jgi:hypothetical protein